MLQRMIEIENRKLLKRRIFWIELSLLSAAIIGLYVIAFTVFNDESSGMSQTEVAEILAWPAGFTNALSVAAGPNLGGILIIVLVGASVAQEYGWGSLRLWLSQGISRPTFLGSKFFVMMMSAFLFVLTAIVVGGVLSAVFSIMLLGRLPFEMVSWELIVKEAVTIAYSLMPYGALAFFLAVAARSTVAAVGGGLAYTLLIEGIVLQLIGSFGGIWGEIGRYVPGGLAQGLLTSEAGLTIEIGETGIAEPMFIDPGPAAIGIGIYVLIFLVLSMIFFRRQDINL